MKTKMLLVMLAAIALMAACKGKSGKGEYEVINNGSTADSVKVMDSNSNAPKLVKTAEMNFKVKDVQQVSERIATLTKQNGGMIMHHQMQSAVGLGRDVHISNDSIMRISAFNTTADMTIKIPSEKLEDFMSQVSKISIYVNVRRMDIEDKSLDYLSAQLKLSNRKELVSQQKKGRVTIKSSSDVLLLRDDLVDEQIGNRKIDEAVKYSLISLNFYQSNTISKEVIANDDPSVYGIPLFQRLGLAFANGWNVFIDVLIGLVNLWVFILAGLSIWMAYRFYKKRIRLTNTATV
ncbi:MAG: hypothetical protein JWP37_2792 [Mucilaginibacter sp.]|nr:hypothetical protein [Mucilaginibacter sp.]